MQIALDSPGKKILTLGLALVATAAYLTLAARRFAASQFARGELRSIETALRLDPENAQYHDMLGQLFFVQQPERALEQFRIAAGLNRYDAHYRLHLAKAAGLLNRDAEQKTALRQAVDADPKTPDIAWEAANFSLASGDTESALREFRVVVEGAPNLAYQALERCTRVVDAGTVLRQVVPPRPAALLAFIDLLTTQNNLPAAANAWEALVRLGDRVDLDRALQYINHLTLQHDVTQARKVWTQTLQLNGMSSYLTGSDNLVVNPSFEFDILNGGFDWRYRRRASVELSLDPSEFHAGRRSLAVSFDGPGISDAGISQLIPVEPDTDYVFSAHFKAENIDGAGGPRFAIEDAYSGTHYFESDDLKNSGVWREVSGQFRTPAGAQLLLLRLLRIPQDSPIRGKLWVDNFRLVEKQP